MSDHWKRSAAEIAGMVRSGAVTARAVTESTLARLDTVNPAINAVVQEMPDQALAAADAIDAAVASGQDPGLLAGVPVTIKVNTDQAGFANTNGVRIQKDLIAETDAPVAANLKKAGAIVVGRTNTPAFSLRWFCRNSLHGETLNPRDPVLTPGGSSGGAAAATVAGIGAIGHATDIAGSIRYPAYACGIHGLRPTLGRVPVGNFSGPDRYLGGQIMAVAGPVARTMEDVALGFEAMSAQDLRDPWWVPVPTRLPELPKTAALCRNPEDLATAPEIDAALTLAAEALQAAGWVVEEVEAPPLRKAAQQNILLWSGEMRRTGGKAVSDEDDPDANHVYRMLCEIAGPLDENAILDAVQYRSILLRDWQMFLSQYPVLLCPVSGELPFRANVDVESDEAFMRCYEAQLLQIGIPFMGLPGLTVATGLAGKAPVGVQVISGRYREDVMIEAGRIIEAAGDIPSPIDP
ncbi:MAG: amidase family protein [Pseudomonadota bacterium]